MQTSGAPSEPPEAAPSGDRWSSTASRQGPAGRARAGVAIAWLAALLIVPALVLSGAYSTYAGTSEECRGFCLTPGEAFGLAAFILGVLALTAFVVGTVTILAVRGRARSTGALLGWGALAGLLSGIPVVGLFGRGFGIL